VTPGRWSCVATVACIAAGVVAATAAAPNPDLQAVQAVCGRCHTTAVFLYKPRSWDRWNDVFADMTQRGANGTDEQLERVTRFFLENLTLVNVNTSAAEELAGVLGVNDEVAQDVIARRQRQRFSNIDQLRAVPGVNIEKLKERKSRILF
jgi:competence ComEA-like helix-hairpin-helix protein